MKCAPQLIGLNIVLLRFTVFRRRGRQWPGLSGALYALLARYTNLEFFNWSYSGLAVVMASDRWRSFSDRPVYRDRDLHGRG